MNKNDITPNDIIQSYETLIDNISWHNGTNLDAMYHSSKIFRQFIDTHKECSSTEELCIAADIEDNEEVKQKLKLRLAAEEYAASMYSLVNDIINQNTQNDGGI